MWQAVEPKVHEFQPEAEGAKRIFASPRPLFRRYSREMGFLAPERLPEPCFVPFFLFTDKGL